LRSRSESRRQRQGKGRGRSTTLTSEVLQQLDLAQGTLGEDLLAEDIGDLFDGDALARLVVGGSAVWGVVLAGGGDSDGDGGSDSDSGSGSNKKGGVPDDAVGTLTELLCDIVALVDDKLLVEDLEDLAVGEVGHGCGWRRRRGRERQKTEWQW
jgi:hypothetical protein